MLARIAPNQAIVPFIVGQEYALVVAPKTQPLG